MGSLVIKGNMALLPSFLVFSIILGFGQTSYVKVFSHNSAKGVFSNAADALSKNPDNPNADLYSILAGLEDFRDANGKFQFKLCYPGLAPVGAKGICNEWIQTSNPATESTITGFEAISLAFTQNSLLNPWKGLGRNLASLQSSTLIDDSPSSSAWWSAIGAFTQYTNNVSIPGPRPNVVSKVELFVKGGFECLDGWTYNNSTFKCYKFVQKKITWSEAHRECLSMIPTSSPPALPVTRGPLPSIRDEEENHFVDSLLLAAHLDAWLGGHLLGDGSWIWTDGSKWTYDNWRCGQAVREDSLYLKSNGDWNVARFSDIMCGYVCQYLDLNQFT